MSDMIQGCFIGVEGMEARRVRRAKELREMRDLVQSGIEAREVALRQVEENADEEWMEAAYAALTVACSKRDTITTDDVWMEIEREHGDYEPHEPRAMGVVIRRARSDGLIKITDRTTPSTRPQNHRRPVRIWEVVAMTRGERER